MSADQGPWGARDGSEVAPTVSVKEHRLGPVSVRIEKTEASPAAPAAPVKGQHPAWAIGSTVALAGLIWWITGSLIVAGAAIFGLFVHEYGHVLAMNRYGMGPARIYVVPFFGGLARGQRGPATEWEGVKVSLAGPVFGLLATIPFFAAWAVLGDPNWLMGAFVIGMINLVNLAPAPPLDGSHALGPVLARLHPGLEKAAMAGISLLAIAWAVFAGFYILAVVMGIAVFGQLRRGLRRPGERPLTGREAGLSFVLFLASLAACAGVAVAALVPVAGSIEGSLAFGLTYLGLGR